MDKQKAYELIKSTLAQVNTTLQGHMVLIQALDVLADKIKTEAPKEEKKAIPQK